MSSIVNPHFIHAEDSQHSVAGLVAEVGISGNFLSRTSQYLLDVGWVTGRN